MAPSARSAWTAAISIRQKPGTRRKSLASTSARSRAMARRRRGLQAAEPDGTGWMYEFAARLLRIRDRSLVYALPSVGEGTPRVSRCQTLKWRARIRADGALRCDNTLHLNPSPGGRRAKEAAQWNECRWRRRALLRRGYLIFTLT